MTKDSDESYGFKRGRGDILVIACGALGREIIDLIEVNHLRHLDVVCLPAKLHHRPQLIAPALQKKIHETRGRYMRTYVLYGDCGTGGEIDRVIAEENEKATGPATGTATGKIERIEGPHCFSFYSGNEVFATKAEEDLTSFFLTDYFCRHFETFVWKALGLDRREDMASFVFGNYEKIVLIPQIPDPDLTRKGQAIADRLGLAFEERVAGYGDLETFLKATDRRQEHVD